MNDRIGWVLRRPHRYRLLLDYQKLKAAGE